MASGIFVAGRQPHDIKDQELDFSIIKYTTSKIDYHKKMVTTSFGGLFPQTAVYREGLGCCLVAKIPPDSVINKIVVLPKLDNTGSWRIAWPKGDQLKDTLFPEINKAKLDSVVQSVFDEKGQNTIRTAAVVVLYKGELVGEKYWNEKNITSDTRLWGWSMNKSIVNALMGILVKKGKLDLNALAPVNEWLSDNRRNITIKDLMHMTSGLKWDESYGSLSDATDMLFRQPDAYKASIASPFANEPDMIWTYSSGTANILSGIIRSSFENDNEYYLFPYKELFNKTGMNSMVLEADAAGTFVGASFGYASARDWARFGLLYYNNGVFAGDTILPKGWVDFTRTPAKASKGKYGALFWLRDLQKLPDAPADLYSCQGHRGQKIFIIPSKNLVIVRLGFSNEDFDQNQFIKGILSTIKE